MAVEAGEDRDLAFRTDRLARQRRRAFFDVARPSIISALLAVWMGHARPAGAADKDFERLVPSDKKLSPEWVRSLFERGTHTVYRGDELERIGMPIGGIGAGQLYLGGDGRLWHWGILNQVVATDGAHYASPMLPSFPLDQGFAVQVTARGKTDARRLDCTGFRDIAFRGEYPIGYITYRDAVLPISVSLTAFSPFIPLNAADSSLPATIMRFTVENTGREKVEARIAGWMENAVCRYSEQLVSGVRRNHLLRRKEMTFLNCRAVPEEGEASSEAMGKPRVLAEFEGDTYGDWSAEGEAFGPGPARGATAPEQHLSGFQGKGLVNTYYKGDGATGKLTSPEFILIQRFINFLVGGGNHPAETCINLVVDGKAVRTETGRNSDAMQWASWNVRRFAGKPARLEIVDRHTGGWGHIDIDQIEFGDSPKAEGVASGELKDQADFGTLGLALCEPHSDDVATASLPDSSTIAKVAPRPAVLVAGFEEDTYGDWEAEGEAMGTGPAKGAMGGDQRLTGFQGTGLANTYRNGDGTTGRLVSPEFTIERRFLNFLIGGGDHPGATCINLIVHSRTARTQTGKNTDAMTWASWDVQPLTGMRVQLEIVDRHRGGWGHIDIDQIEQADEPQAAVREAPEAVPAGLFSTEAGEATRPFGPRPIGALTRRVTLAPGQEATVTFIIAWHFPNLRLNNNLTGRNYASRFDSAEAVAQFTVRNLRSLTEQTHRWHDTWYDSTLPYWLLDRTFANTSTLATSTCYWLGNGRFYGFEGVGCCHGTCTHVWHYAQAVARIFPELERTIRETVDYGVGFNPQTGVIGHRGEGSGPAVDGQAGTILRTYREHQTSTDDAFLKRNWPKVRKAVERLIQQDGNGDGILEGAQHNTLDAAWYGSIPWLSSLYLAALRAGEEMAFEIGDESFAKQARAIVDAGTRKIDELWNREYYVQIADPNHRTSVGSYDGCSIDQVFGQSWAFQVGLGRILSEDKVRGALQSLWKYNFAPDVGPYRTVHKAGRWFAMPGEGGLLMVTFPKGIVPEFADDASAWSAMYFNECMSGFEYQVAGHMIWEGMVKEGLALVRTIHDRYRAARRNPYNEVECGDHYARAMASYGVFVAACGYEYHGPKGYLAFAPRLTPQNFRAAFTSAEGWGTFSQRCEGQVQRETIAVKWGKLRVRTLAFALGDKVTARTVTAKVNGKTRPSKQVLENNRLRITLASEVNIQAGQKIEVVIG